MSDITERLAALDSCVVSDALDALGIAGVATGLSRLATDTKVVGRVHTVKLEDAKGRKAERHLCTGAVGAAAPGEVIVVEHHDRSDCAGWGGLLSRAASVKGIAGTIIDGLSRDIDEAVAFGYPVFGRGGTPATARNRIIETAMGIDVTIGGIPVSPGDYVIADGSGVVFVPQARADEVVTSAETFFAREQDMARAIDAGTPVAEVMAGNYERMLENG
ncbi:MAG: hypothetical protein KDK28_09820 [Maritimibacter sp.]|nr:hypothetical protein [Maritimibacter sp.]